MTANAAPTVGPHNTRDLRRQVIVATALLFLMLYPHGGALGLASAPLFLLCLHAFVRLGAGLYSGELASAPIFGCSASEDIEREAVAWPGARSISGERGLDGVAGWPS